jgi:hypothetical protein
MTTSTADQLLRELVECGDDTTPNWPPTAGDKVLGRGVTGDPGPTYVLADPRDCAGEPVVPTVSHHQLTAVVDREHHTGPIENPAEKALEAVELGRLSPTISGVEGLKLYRTPPCERCEAQGRGRHRPLDRPVPVSAGGEEVDMWLCRECFGFYKGLTAARDGGGEA